MKKFSVISYHPTENGYDEKKDCNTLAEAFSECKILLSNGYEKAFIIKDKRIVLVFDEYHHNGRNPYDHEVKALFSA